MNMMRKMIKDILTGADNHSFDNGRVMCVLSFLTFFVMALISVRSEHAWGAMDFAGGVSAMAVGFGFNLRLKRSTEPKKKEEHE